MSLEERKIVEAQPQPQPINVLEYEELARPRVQEAHWDFYAGGSDDEVTLRANRTAFERIRLRPRVLVDVSTIDTGTSALGTPVSMPILVAPTAQHGLAHTEAEIATARAAGKAGTIMIASTSSTRSLEEIAEAARGVGGPLWFQLYIFPTLDVGERLVRRAEEAGYKAIVLTVDLPRLGNRERDRRSGFVISFEGNFVSEQKIGSRTRIPLTWDTLAWLRSITPLPILLKGILTAEDALLAVEHGVDGIVVSNHGGRQLDGALAGIEALPEVVEAVSGRCEVYMDGGIRRGTDVLKALALGARAVLVGRPILWGLAVNGEAGVFHILEILRSELELAMVLSGRPSIASIDRSLVKIM
jgi:isopentenyl diphosphate isomerase/L-lactate dehydrogenase-like FMN-dependent dehydrogenase